MTLRIFPDYTALAEAAAAQLAALVRDQPDATLCLASGETPVGTYRAFVRHVRDQELDVSRLTFVGLDEWVGIGPDNSGSCFFLVNAEVFEPLGIRPEQIYFFNPLAENLEAECARIDQAVAERGGLDAMLVGVGMNGHIALNEPGTPWDRYAHVVELEETTKTVGQKYFASETTLTRGITMGLRYLREARLPLLLISGAKKAPVAARALTGEVGEAYPASIFQTLDHGVVLLDEPAAGELDRLLLFPDAQ
jgi:galactosamine-6-phosphate isomerase